jgi:hypothetical protein
MTIDFIRAIYVYLSIETTSQFHLIVINFQKNVNLRAFVLLMLPYKCDCSPTLLFLVHMSTYSR